MKTNHYSADITNAFFGRPV